MSKVLISGATGFLGTQIRKDCRKNGIEHICLTTNKLWSEEENFIFLDQYSPSELAKILYQHKPSLIYQCASVNGSQPSDSLYHINHRIIYSFLEAIRVSALRSCKIIQISSSAVYGCSSSQEIAETDDPLPLSHYGLSKLQNEQLCEYYERVHGIKSIIIRLFNLIGPGLSEIFFAGKLAKAVVQAEQNRIATIETGSLDSSRDFLDVRDASEALLLLVNSEIDSGIFNLCSGKEVQLRRLAQRLQELGLAPLEIRENQITGSSGLILRQRGKSEKIKSALSWKPQIGLDESLESMLEYQRIIESSKTVQLQNE
jgi:GDP-4-dehydro-6-deoxy-D-mannose reductase